MHDLERWRDEFPILSRTVYMISNSLGAMPQRTARNLAEYADTWATRGVRGWEERWWEMPLEVGNKIAGVIRAPLGSVSMHENVTTAHLVALSCLRPSGARRRIVCSAMDFPSMVHLFARRRPPTELTVVPAEDDLTVREQRIVGAIDDAPRGRVLTCCSGRRTSWICAHRDRARAAGAAVILDAYQSAGIVPVDVSALGVDFAVGGCLKWLCGRPSAFLHATRCVGRRIRPGWLALAPSRSTSTPAPSGRRVP
jgi:kynureninase